MLGGRQKLEVDRKFSSQLLPPSPRAPGIDQTTNNNHNSTLRQNENRCKQSKRNINEMEKIFLNMHWGNDTHSEKSKH